MSTVDEAAAGTGVVVRYEQARGFGFVKPDSGGPDIFVHASVIPDSVRATFTAGQRVEYTMFHSSLGPKARSVSVISAAPVMRPVPSLEEDEGPDVLTSVELTWEISEALKGNVAPLRVTRVIEQFVILAKRHGWVSDD